MADVQDAAMVKQERRVRASKESEYKVKLQARGHSFFADEPKQAGGTDEAPTPRELALGSLAACVTVITGKVAKGLDFKYSDQSIEVRGTADPQGAKNADNNISPNFDYVEVKITLVTDEPEDRIEELKRQHHGRCPISALFRESGCELVEDWNIVRP